MNNRIVVCQKRCNFADPAPESINSWQAQRGQDIKMPGEGVEVLSSMSNANFYARYLRTVEDYWDWTDDCSSATVTLKDPEGNTLLTLSSDNGDVTISSEEEDGYIVYTATATHDFYDYTYTFTDQESKRPQVMIHDDEDNTAALQANSGKTADVTLKGRTLYKDGTWNTICLPFNVDNFNYTPLEGADVRTLMGSSYDESTGVLTLTFSESNMNKIYRGYPYIIRWPNGGDNETSPVFKEVNVYYSSISLTPTSKYVDFCPTLKPNTLAAGDRSVLYLGANNALYYPSTAVNIGSCRGYFQLKGITASPNPSQGGENPVRSFVLNFGDGEETGIANAEANSSFFIHHSSFEEAWFALDGRCLSGKPTQRGIYIKNGKKVVIK